MNTLFNPMAMTGMHPDRRKKIIVLKVAVRLMKH